MRRFDRIRTSIVAAAATLALAVPLLAQQANAPAAWSHWRGPAQTGVAPGDAPTTWSDATNVAWKVEIPGRGHSSPVVWGNQVCTASAVSGQPDPQLKVGLYGDITSVVDTTEHRWLVICYDKQSGKQLWQQTAHTGVPKVKRHTKSTHASSTLATDGRYVLAFFGSEGLFAYDMNGKPIWKKDFGLLDSGFFMVPDAQWGFGSSPVIHGDQVIIQVDVQKGSFVAALDIKTGNEIWRTPRSDVPTWSTPAVLVAGGRSQVIVNGWTHIGGYDLATGKELWRMTGGGDIPVPTPITAHGLIFITNAHGPGAPVYAVRPGARGDVSLPQGQTSSEHVAWSQSKEGAYMQTPLVYGDQLYVCRDNGVLSVYQAKTGTRLYQERLADGKTGFTASPVAADGKVYFTSEEGDVYVVKAGPQFELLGQNPLGEVILATPAVSEGSLYFRTRGHLVAVGGKSKR